ncbi:MAG: hypothetical protein JWQ33_2717 [Ramlibacter sp.]|nr:hypothetical protein [Ramlibacter sp.]
MSPQAYTASQTLIPRANAGKQGLLRELFAATPLAIFARALGAALR